MVRARQGLVYLWGWQAGCPGIAGCCALGLLVLGHGGLHLVEELLSG